MGAFVSYSGYQCGRAAHSSVLPLEVKVDLPHGDVRCMHALQASACQHKVAQRAAVTLLRVRMRVAVQACMVYVERRVVFLVVLHNGPVGAGKAFGPVALEQFVDTAPDMHVILNSLLTLWDPRTFPSGAQRTGGSPRQGRNRSCAGLPYAPAFRRRTPCGTGGRGASGCRGRPCAATLQTMCGGLTWPCACRARTV